MLLRFFLSSLARRMTVLHLFKSLVIPRLVEFSCILSGSQPVQRDWLKYLQKISFGQIGISLSDNSRYSFLVISEIHGDRFFDVIWSVQTCQWPDSHGYSKIRWPFVLWEALHALNTGEILLRQCLESFLMLTPAQYSAKEYSCCSHQQPQDSQTNQVIGSYQRVLTEWIFPNS